MTEKKNRRNRIPFILIIAAVAVAGGAIGGWLIFHDKTPETEQNENISSKNVNPDTDFSKDYSDYSEYSPENMEQKVTESISPEQQQKNIAKEQCDSYLDAYGDSTPEELASNDKNIKAEYNEWQDWLAKAKEAEGSQFTPEQCQTYWSKNQPCPSQYAEKAQQAEASYNQLLSQKTEYYKDLKANSCKDQ